MPNRRKQRKKPLQADASPKAVSNLLLEYHREMAGHQGLNDSAMTGGLSGFVLIGFNMLRVAGSTQLEEKPVDAWDFRAHVALFVVGSLISYALWRLWSRVLAHLLPRGLIASQFDVYSLKGRLATRAEYSQAVMTLKQTRFSSVHKFFIIMFLVLAAYQASTLVKYCVVALQIFFQATDHFPKSTALEMPAYNLPCQLLVHVLELRSIFQAVSCSKKPFHMLNVYRDLSRLVSPDSWSVEHPTDSPIYTLALQHSVNCRLAGKTWISLSGKQYLSEFIAALHKFGQTIYMEDSERLYLAPLSLSKTQLLAFQEDFDQRLRSVEAFNRTNDAMFRKLARLSKRLKCRNAWQMHAEIEQDKRTAKFYLTLLPHEFEQLSEGTLDHYMVNGMYTLTPEALIILLLDDVKKPAVPVAAVAGYVPPTCRVQHKAISRKQTQAKRGGGGAKAQAASIRPVMAKVLQELFFPNASCWYRKGQTLSKDFDTVEGNIAVPFHPVFMSPGTAYMMISAAVLRAALPIVPAGQQAALKREILDIIDRGKVAMKGDAIKPVGNYAPADIDCDGNAQRAAFKVKILGCDMRLFARSVDRIAAEAADTPDRVLYKVDGCGYGHQNKTINAHRR